MTNNQKDKNIYCIEDVLERSLSGWINGITPDEIAIPLCYKTKVSLREGSKRGQVVVVQEGCHKDTTVIIPYKYQDSSGTISYLSQSLPNKKTALFYIKTKEY